MASDFLAPIMRADYLKYAEDMVAAEDRDDLDEMARLKRVHESAWRTTPPPPSDLTALVGVLAEACSPNSKRARLVTETPGGLTTQRDQ